MTAALVLVLAGVLIALYPRLLVLLVSGALITAGLAILLIRWRLRRFLRTPTNAFLNFFLRW